MNRKTYNQVVISGLSACLSLGLNSTLLSASVQANEKASVSSENVAVKQIENEKFSNSRLYQHQLKDKEVVTLQYKNLPLLTFIVAPDYDAKAEATKLAQNLEQLSQGSVDAAKIIVSWNKETKDYSVKYDEQELVKINQFVTLPDSTNHKTSDALQFTNRLRRLMGNAKPLTAVKGKPKVVAKVDRYRNPSLVKSSGRSYRGQASWYGPGFHGRKTANGERFNQNALTAAHRTLPFGTKVKVTNMRNGRSVVVRINDRGPFSGGRIIDLSAAAANVIGMRSSGVAPVRVDVLAR